MRQADLAQVGSSACKTSSTSRRSTKTNSTAKRRKRGRTPSWQFSRPPKREPPTPQTDEEVKALWQRDNGREVIATPEVERACAQLAQIKANLKAGKEAKESLDVLIKNAIGEAAALRSADRSRILATWKNSKDKLSFNKTQFAIDNPSLYERYTSMTPGSRRFLLK